MQITTIFCATLCASLCLYINYLSAGKCTIVHAIRRTSVERCAVWLAIQDTVSPILVQPISLSCQAAGSYF